LAIGAFHATIDWMFPVSYLACRKNLPHRHPDVWKETQLERDAEMGIRPFLISWLEL
jgi:hypothetical protein